MEVFRATVEDAAEILALQKAVYTSEAQLHDDYNIPPLTQTLSEIQREFITHTFLKVVDGGRIIASVKAFEGNGTCYIGRLIVATDYQRRGIGTMLMGLIEKEFSHLKHFELYTGKKSLSNINMYNKLGYSIFREQNLNARTILVFMEKRV